MFCPANANTGLVQLVGPIAASDLKSMTNAQAPLSIKFEPRSTPPSLSGNQIIESPNNTCTYNAQKFNFIPKSADVLFHTMLLHPNESDTIYFIAPEKPGEYVYICTYPGHYLVMRGILKVL